MSYYPERPVIVQSDRSILLEVQNPMYEQARDRLARFAELIKSPEFIHTYHITPLSLWNAAATGDDAERVIEMLSELAKFALPANIVTDIREYMGRYGRIRLQQELDTDTGEVALVLVSHDKALIAHVWNHKSSRPFLLAQRDETSLIVDPTARGHIKQALVQLGFPAEDSAGYVTGDSLPLRLRSETLGRKSFSLRDYQRNAVERFYDNGSIYGGSGVVVLPCGAGKTVVGLAALELAQTQTLILCPNTVAVRQWQTELIDKTTLSPDEVGEYTGERKEIRPVTIATYQILTHRVGRSLPNEDGEGEPGLSIDDFPHLKIFNERNWGMIIYDEVHLLPAPVFRITAEIQARRRLGLTATLIREDGRESDVFSLIGPKKYDVPWRDLERQGWIAIAHCTEIRLNMPEELRMEYALAEDGRAQYRIAAENPVKRLALRSLLELHHNDQVLVIGQYIDQLNQIARETGAPLITGRTSNSERERLYSAFRNGEIKLLIVSKVANFAIDLPDANVAIQVSGSYGSRQEEAQRLGRILRPKSDGRPAFFYTLVTRDSRDQDFAMKRQLFLTEQGYHYTIVDSVEAIV
jgi:DNA excision repair protein ERCC-3